MPIRAMNATDKLRLARGSAVVCVLLRGDGSRNACLVGDIETVRSVLDSTDATMPLLLLGSSNALEQIGVETAAGAGGRMVRCVELREDLGEVAALNDAMVACAPSDVVLLTGGTQVAGAWLESLRRAALSDSTVGSATPFCLDPGGLRLADDERSRGRERQPAVASSDAAGHRTTLADVAKRVAETSLQVRPRIAVIGPRCAYIRRASLELAGLPDRALPFDAALADLARRMIAAGMVHVAADDVVVGGSSEFGQVASGLASEDPVEATLAQDERGSLRRASGIAAVALRPLRVTIDGRALTAAVGGTQTYIIDLVLALGRDSRVAVRVLVPPDLSGRGADALAAADVELLSYEHATDGARRDDVVHRPQSVFTPDDLSLLRLVGERVVIGQLDLIAYHNYSYHRDIDAWRAYRRTTRLALGAADQVVFFSEHARRDALAEDLVSPSRAHMVSIGSDPLAHVDAPDAPPSGLAAPNEPFLLCLGADYAHKNRVFALELLGALRDIGWKGHLVLAGAHVPLGSSRERERELLSARGDLAKLTSDLGLVGEDAKAWLYAHARALVYPTVYEGFGLLPLEAARSGLPCLFAAQASLAELAAEQATLVPWDASASAAACISLLEDGAARDRHVAGLRALALPTWDDVAARLVSVYEQALSTPSPEGAERVWEALDRERHIVELDRAAGELKATAQEYQDAYHALDARVSNGLPLIDDGGLLTRAQQRGLMRIAARKPTTSLLLAPLGLLGRIRRQDGSGDDG